MNVKILTKSTKKLSLSKIFIGWVLYLKFVELNTAGMSLFVCSLNSGSNGNCYYVGNSEEAVLIDVGISCRETEKRMLQLGLNIRKVKAIFISHEHSDHITGVPVLARKYQLPVYITETTYRMSDIPIDQHLITELNTSNNISIGGLSVTAFSKNHDACDPTSFIVAYNNIKVGIFTDIGKVCKNLIYYFKQCHAAFLEANYDEEMLNNGRYPFYLKKRITGGNGHLSNTEALQLCVDHRPSFMSHLFLSHLSKENNCPNLVRNLFTRTISNMEIIVASRYEATPVYSITPQPKRKVGQLTLF